MPKGSWNHQILGSLLKYCLQDSFLQASASLLPAPCLHAEEASPPCFQCHAEAEIKTLLCKHPETTSAPKRRQRRRNEKQKLIWLLGNSRHEEIT